MHKKLSGIFRAAGGLIMVAVIHQGQTPNGIAVCIFVFATVILLWLMADTLKRKSYEEIKDNK